MTANLLIVEDHADIAQMLISYLESKGYSVDYAKDGLAGSFLALNNTYDLILMDLTLPGMDGISLCEKLRSEAKIACPIIMLTARDTVKDKVSGLDAGADDYLVKPFSFVELEARVRAQLRRNQGETTKQKLTVGDLCFDPDTRKVTRADQDIQLTPIAQKILLVLMQASPAVVDREALERKVWGQVMPESDTLRSHIYTLRKKIDKPFDKPLLQTHQSNGYQLVST